MLHTSKSQLLSTTSRRLLVTNNNKASERKDKVLFIQAVDEIRKEKTMSYLDDIHIDKIIGAYKAFTCNEGFSAVLDKNIILSDKNARLNVQLYVKKERAAEALINDLVSDWQERSTEMRSSMSNLFEILNLGKKK